jgi:choline dehydrogenase-like flavoprotein
MLAFAQNYPPDHEFSADICIVGTGAAGITLAHKLLQMQTGKSILVLESANLDSFGLMSEAHMRILREYGTYPPQIMAQAGLVAGHRGYDPVAEHLYEGVESSEMAALDPAFLTRSRLRAYGGTTNCWGGWTRPLSRIDFQRVELGMPWPITGEALYQAGYYDEAMHYCSLPPVGVDRYDQEDFWLATVQNIQFLDLQQAGGKLVNAVFLAVNQQRLDFQTVWGPALEAADAEACTVLRNANVRFVGSNAGSRSVSHLFGSTIENDAHGRNFTVRADRYVLATGGIEVPRLLLSSAASGGFTADNDNLGRYFQIHPLNNSYATFERGPNQPTNNMINLYQTESTVPIGTYRAGMFATLAPADGALVDLKLRNFRARVYFSSGVINMNWEQAPNADSRVLLSLEKDRFWGDPLTRLNWQTLPVDEETPATGLALIAGALERLGYGRNFKHTGPTIAAPGDHHMGTARMADSRENGYVDANCQVFGADNLFIASSAVFTTSGYANPTLSIVALAARLADYLAGKRV